MELKLEKKIDVEMGSLEKYKILSGQSSVGRLSMVKFQIFEPFSLGWTFLEEICIEPKYRQKGIAKHVVENIGCELNEDSRNGILMNAINIEGAKNLYDNLGWKRLKVDSSWQVLINVNVSEFIIRKTLSIVSQNLVKWQASSPN